MGIEFKNFSHKQAQSSHFVINKKLNAINIIFDFNYIDILADSTFWATNCVLIGHGAVDVDINSKLNCLRCKFQAHCDTEVDLWAIGPQCAINALGPCEVSLVDCTFDDIYCEEGFACIQFENLQKIDLKLIGNIFMNVWDNVLPVATRPDERFAMSKTMVFKNNILIDKEQCKHKLFQVHTLPQP